MFNKKTVEDIQVSGKKVLVRCDFNVPLDGETITDPKRIVEALPTIKYLSSNGAKVILCSHLGRPKGEFNAKYSLKPVAAKLSELLGKEIVMASDVIGEDAQARPLLSTTAISCSSKMFVSTRKKKRTIPHSQRLSLLWLTYT